jgi:hypothetical protein
VNTLQPALVDESAALALAKDARIVALRWDLLEWGLVLDLDVPSSEREDSTMRRAWLVFSGVSEVTLPMEATRLPSGIWLTSSLAAEDRYDGFRVYTCWALLPTFDNDEVRTIDVSHSISIQAQSLVGILSPTPGGACDYGLTYRTRTSLASDQAMLEAIGYQSS